MGQASAQGKPAAAGTGGAARETGFMSGRFATIW